MNLSWTNTPPTEEGWYWMRNLTLTANTATIERVFKRPGHEYLCINAYGNCGHVKRHFWPVEKLSSEWAGPISKPEGGEK